MGEYASLDDLVYVHRVDRSYLGHLLRLTALAPDAMAAMLCGDEPENRSLA